MKDTWIWLPKEHYPDCRTTKYDAIDDRSNDGFSVAEFRRDYRFDREIASVTLRFSGDTEVQLYEGGRLLATGPVAVGGDFIGNGRPRGPWFAGELTFEAEGRRALSFLARVKLTPTRLYEYSKGHGGFMLSATVTFRGGGREEISTDGSWLSRRLPSYCAVCRYDGRLSPDPFVPAEVIPDIWEARVAPIPVREERAIPLLSVTLAPREKVTRVLPLDRIYAGYVELRSRGTGEAFAILSLRELPGGYARRESAALSGEDGYRGFFLHSAGEVTAELENLTDEPYEVEATFLATCYPVVVEAVTETGDAGLDAVLNTARHTLRYCRQTHHLDSPTHCEPLACTGDYYIEALMTAFSFGDQRLSELDLLRTAAHLTENDGRMFHTTYSLIFVRMLRDVYLLGGNLTLLRECRPALDLLLARFSGYLGESGLLETPPDYMFVDWIYIDGHSLHHPPRALGETVLNLFYYVALTAAREIYRALGDDAAAADCQDRAAALRTAVNTHLYDAERGLYFEGRNTKTPEGAVGKWLPENIDRRYYLKHSNIMAAYSGICDKETARELIGKIMREEIEGDVQPYFLHYLLEAIYENGLREEYTLAVVDRWREPVRECPKGLVEGFYPPEPTYSFDHSHAWGGTPLWSLPRALSGLEILTPGLSHLRLSPSLLGLSRARVELPTPYGMLVLRMEEGEEPRVSAPEGVTVEVGR